MLMSVGLRTSRIRTIDVTDNEPSLIASAIVCECGSMIPGMTYLPVASITWAPAGAVRFLPIWAIFPFCSNTSVFCRVPLVTVSTVAFFINVGPAFAPGCCAPATDAAARQASVPNKRMCDPRVEFMAALANGRPATATATLRGVGLGAEERALRMTDDRDRTANHVAVDRAGEARLLGSGVHRHGGGELDVSRRPDRPIRDL